MRKLVVQSFVSLDGVVQAPGAPDEDVDGGFEHGGWLVPRLDEAFLHYVTESTERAGALLLGRKTYEIFAGSWPLVGDDDPVAAVLNHIPKYVASRTLANAEWNNTTVISGDITDAVSALKQQPGNEIQVHGSGELIQTLLRHDLVDEFRILTAPALVGSGKRLFGNGTIPRDLRLAGIQTTPAGAIYSTFERTGELTVGAYGPEQETTA